MTAPMTAIIYAAKSTADEHDSIPGQLKDCRKLAGDAGLEVGRAFQEASQSGYSKSRGGQLKAALDECERLAAGGEKVALVVQHSDRLARGDGKKAKHLVEYALWAIKTGVTIRSVEDDHTFGDLLYAVVTGQRNHEDSARKSSATRKGLSRRKERGEPVGALPVGYVREVFTVEGVAVSKRVIDPTGAANVKRIFALAEERWTPGQISKTLNAEKAVTARGKAWTTRAVRRVLENEDYTGTTGYPVIIEPERFEQAQKLLARLDPAAVQARKGGRPPGADFLLAGVATCLVCGAPMRCRRYRTGTRVYRCRDGMEGIGLCAARPVPAEAVESLVVDNLHVYVGDLEKWLLGQLEEREAEHRVQLAALDLERKALADLGRQRERHLTQYRALVAEGSSLARIALEEVERIDADRAAQEEAIRDAQEWTGRPDLRQALDLYDDLLATVRGDLAAADSTAELAAAVRSLLAEVRVGLDDGLLRIESRLWSKPDRTPSCRSTRSGRRSRRRRGRAP